jgi:DNA modification methylase
VSYIDFLKSKIEIAKETGFNVSTDEINPVLKPHQRDAVQWAVKGGRRALFESFGLGKTVQELEFCRIVTEREGGKALIVLPLGVKQEFTHDAVQLLGMEPPEYVRNMTEAKKAAGKIILTNYERVRDGDIVPKYFTATSLDEASVLRSFGSKTYQTFLDKFKGVPFKLVSTATPSPNKFKELIHYAGYLEVMDTGQALTRFFQRDSTKANNLTLYPHKEDEFWLWVSTWALFITRPSDLGYPDDGYDLPPLNVRYHEIPVNHKTAGAEKDGQLKLVRDAATGLTDAAREKRDSISARIGKMAEIIEESPDDHFILWHDLEAERYAIEEALPSVEYNYWHKYKDGNQKGLELYERHYSAYQYADGRERKLFCGPGEKTVLLTHNGDALFVWRKFIDASGQKGVNCAVFRNESEILSSELIKEAMAIAWLRWPGERLYTYVNADKILSVNPGYCFKQAGWKACGETNGGLKVLEALPGYAVPEIAPKRALESIYGSQDLDIREKRVIDFSEGRIKLFATKKELSGSGCNFQRHCHRAIFLGIDYQFNDFIQAIHRVYCFLQTEQVTIDIIHTESERQVLQALLQKWEQHNYLVEKMTAIIKKYGLSSTSVIDKLARSIGVERVKIETEHYTAVNNDCVLETEQMTENSIDLIHTSIPFSNHYEYTPSYNDFGHNENTARFFEQMDYLTPQLLRILKPGRVFACHVKDRVLFGNATGTGMPTMEPFHALCIDHYRRHGFQYFGMITVITDVVRENNQTYRLGWSEQCKDGTKMGVGCPEYILLFRKLPTDTSKAYADVPVSKTKEQYTWAQWQIDAHGFYRSSGNRFLSKDELARIPIENLQNVYRKFSRENVYDYQEHVDLAKRLDKDGRLPASFMVVAPGSWHEEVWDDINRMKTLNSQQSQKRLQMHVCPLQIDIVERIINRYSNPGDTVFDPFAGLFTVPERAVRMGRRGYGIELNTDYFRDGVGYLKAAETAVNMPTLFDFMDKEVG